MEKDLLAELYSDINALNKVIKDEIVNEQKDGIININLYENDNVIEFLEGFSEQNQEKKIIHLVRKKTLNQQLKCTELQKKEVKRILK